MGFLFNPLLLLQAILLIHQLRQRPGACTAQTDYEDVCFQVNVKSDI